jgi:hypothetical protein
MAAVLAGVLLRLVSVLREQSHCLHQNRCTRYVYYTLACFGNITLACFGNINP